MIVYESAKLHPLRLFQWKGSVMPFSCGVALPCALLTVGIKLLPSYVSDGGADGVWDLLGLEGSAENVAGAAFSGMNFLIGFLVVFRSSQAYNRFWEGLSSINSMQGEWWDAASSLCAFCKCSTAAHEEIILFQHTLVRLISMLNGCVLMELSAGFHREQIMEEEHMKSKRAFELELIDAEGIDSESLRAVNSATEKVELVFQWIQQLVVESDVKDVFSVSGPVLSRAFQELSNGMVQYRQASKIARTPLPFPYMQATELLLISHWLCTPVLMCVWVESPLWAGILCFIQVMFYWSLNSIATELENPFGEDANDLPAKEIQQDFNKRLLLLIRPATTRTAKLSKEAAFEETQDAKEGGLKFGKTVTLGQDGVNHKRLLGRRNSLEENKISWGTLQSSIQDKINMGYTSENVSEEGHSLLGDAVGRMPSRSYSKNLGRPHVNPKNRSPRRFADQIRPNDMMDYQRSLDHSRSQGSKDLPPFSADILHTRDYKQIASLMDPERLGSQLACLASLPELLTVCADVRDQLKAAVAAEEVFTEEHVGMPTVEEGVEAAEIAVETPMSPEAVHRAFGKPIGDSGCLGIRSCGSQPPTSRV